MVHLPFLTIILIIINSTSIKWDDPQTYVKDLGIKWST